jgi:hypothetical protein
VFVGGLEGMDGALISGKGCFEKLQGLVASSEFDPSLEGRRDAAMLFRKTYAKSTMEEICL